MLRVYSVFASIQGESSRAGLPCGFVRLAGCPLCCSYCDTREACEAEGDPMTVDEVVSKVSRLGPKLVEVTGGEPLAQAETTELLRALSNAGFEVMLETSGAFSIENIDRRVRIVMDIKTPGSNMSSEMRLENLNLLSLDRCEIKFVLTSREDFNWAIEMIRQRDLHQQAGILLSPAQGLVPPDILAEWILAESLPLRIQLQLHKIVWPDGEGER